MVSHGVAQGQGNRLNERCLHRRATFLLRYRKHRLFSDTRRWKAFGKVTYGLQRHWNGASSINIQLSWQSKTTIGSVIALFYRLKSLEPVVGG